MTGHRKDSRDGRDHSCMTQYDQSKPIRGFFVFEDGTYLPFTKGRYVNGVERKVKYVEIDGVRYEPNSRQHEESIEWMNEC